MASTIVLIAPLFSYGRAPDFPRFVLWGMAAAVEPKKGRRSGARLHAAALAARREALEHLGVDARHFTAAIERYVHAIEVADEAWRSWSRDGRPQASGPSVPFEWRVIIASR